jgi:hypothetical protein
MPSQSKRKQSAPTDDDEGSAEQPRVKQLRGKRRKLGKKKAARANIEEKDRSSVEQASDDVESKVGEDANDGGGDVDDDWDVTFGNTGSSCINLVEGDDAAPPPPPKRDVKALLGRSIVTNVSCGVCGASSEDYRVLVVSVHTLQVNHSLRFSTKCSF